MGGFAPNLDYLAGFFDGEGSICIALHKAKKYTYGCHWIPVQAFNLDRRPLDLFEREFGGTVRWGKRSNAKKAGWIWASNATRDWKFSDSLRNKLFIKSPVLEAAISYRKRLINNRLSRAERKMTKNEFLEREKIRKFVSDYNHRRVSGTFPRDFVLTAPYLAGLFDGEGSVGIQKTSVGRSYTLTISIGSTCSPLLQLLKKNFRGHVSFEKWSTAAKIAEGFLRLIQPYLIVKNKVVDEALKIRILNGPIGTNVKADVVAMKKIRASVQKLNRRAA